MKRKWTRHEELSIIRGESILRDEYLNYMRFEENRRPLFTEIFGPIIGLKEEWEAQGASQQELDFSAFRYRCEKRHDISAKTGFFGGVPEVVIAETAEDIISQDSYGRRMRLVKGSATLPLPLDFPVRGWEDWLRFRHHYQFTADRFQPGWLETARQKQAEGCVLSLSIPGGFDELRQLMGEEAVCLAVYDQPDLLTDMLNTITETVLKIVDQVSSAVVIDRLFVHEDMAGKSGPLFGPRAVRRFIHPYYRQVWDLAAERGTMVFDQDSDGNMNAVIEAFLEAGINAMHPVEPAAGMDMVQLRCKYGDRLAFTGGIDKHVLRRSREEIEAELEYKLPPMIHSGGCVLALDHRIPNGTPLQNYRYYIQKVWDIINRETR
ncbi:MAG: hypothetical protein HPY85_15320 [Anaerolineae bacterium]|nr:hypothetical protein [Anaerolineae bacterium]